MGFDSTPIQTRYLARQTEEPGNPVDGFYWINPEGGQNGNNAEQYIYNADTQAWELIRSVGPDTPLHPAVGANWRDTANNQTLTNTDGTGTGWVPVGVNDHADLENVQSGQHHNPPNNTNTSVGETFTATNQSSIVGKPLSQITFDGSATLGGDATVEYTDGEEEYSWGGSNTYDFNVNNRVFIRVVNTSHGSFQSAQARTFPEHSHSI